MVNCPRENLLRGTRKTVADTIHNLRRTPYGTDIFTLPLSSLSSLTIKTTSPASSLELSHQSISSPSGSSSFGILSLRSTELASSSSSSSEITEEAARAFADVRSRLRKALSVKVFVAVQDQDQEEEGHSGLEERLESARALFRAFIGHSNDQIGSATATPPAHTVAAALRLSTVRSASASASAASEDEEKGGEGRTEQEWDDWQVAFVWHDVE